MLNKKEFKVKLFSSVSNTMINYEKQPNTELSDEMENKIRRGGIERQNRMAQIGQIDMSLPISL